MRASFAGAAGMVAIALAGCSMAPPYSPPQITTPVAYKEGGPWTPASPADAQPRGQWWSVYGDATLGALEARAESGNPADISPTWATSASSVRLT